MLNLIGIVFKCSILVSFLQHEVWSVFHYGEMKLEVENNWTSFLGLQQMVVRELVVVHGFVFSHHHKKKTAYTLPMRGQQQLID